MTLDLEAALVLLALLLGTALRYAVHVTTSGPVRFARVDAAGASPLVGKRAMEMGYWSLQPLARACVRAGVSADAVTAISLALGAAAGVAISLGHLGLGGALASASSLGDALDGLVARATGRATRRGGVFDAAVDRYEEFFFVGGLALHYHVDRGKLGLALLAILGAFMVSYATAKAEALGVPSPGGAMRRAERAVYLCAGAVLSPIAGAVAASAGLAPWAADLPPLGALALVGVIANLSAVRRLHAVGRAASAPVRARAHDGSAEAPPAPPLETGVVPVAPRPSSPTHPAPGLASP